MTEIGPASNNEPPLTDEELMDFREWREERNQPKRIIVGISGASMQQYGIRTVEVLSQTPNIETHCVITEGAKYVMALEMFPSYSLNQAMEQIQTLIDDFQEKGVTFHNNNDQGQAISSGSYLTDAMIVIPCSAKTLHRIAWASDDDLLSRAAFCTLKEHGRSLVVVPRETPITLAYIDNLRELKRNGACILPPVPAFYNGPQDIQGIIDHTVGKVLDQLRIPHNLYKRWSTPKEQNLN